MLQRTSLGFWFAFPGQAILWDHPSFPEALMLPVFSPRLMKGRRHLTLPHVVSSGHQGLRRYTEELGHHPLDLQSAHMPGCLEMITLSPATSQATPSSDVYEGHWVCQVIHSVHYHLQCLLQWIPWVHHGPGKIQLNKSGDLFGFIQQFINLAASHLGSREELPWVGEKERFLKADREQKKKLLANNALVQGKFLPKGNGRACRVDYLISAEQVIPHDWLKVTLLGEAETFKY